MSAFIFYGLLAAAVAGDAARIVEVTRLLRAEPAGFGRPAGDRRAWNALVDAETRKRFLATAAELLHTPIPAQPDKLYLDFSKTGNRSRWQEVARRRRGRLKTLALAECLEHKGRFIPALEQTIRALCRERTWVMPAHDRGLTNFHGKSVDIDLGSATLSHTMAICCYLLGDKLKADVCRQIRANLHRRTFTPFLDMAAGRRRGNWWLQTTNNWNAVCLAGVVGAAVTVIEDKSVRARFIVAAEDLSTNFLRGFGPDGYCTEGLGYWNYGFGHYVMLSESIYQATGGKLDLLQRREVRAPALFGTRLEIIGKVYPSFADCGVGTQPNARLMRFLNRRFQLGREPQAQVKPHSSSGSLAEVLMYSFPNSSHDRTARLDPDGAVENEELRTWFKASGVLLCRPGGKGRFGVALKGGHNAEHHNHNDIGSYVVVVGDDPVLLDPGSEVYTARTFSRRRYVSKVLNSYGHPVPLVAGELQRPGKAAAARVVETRFTPAADRLVLDLRAAYNVPALKSLTRTFVYSRAGVGKLTVRDEVEFSSPQSFGTAVVTLGRRQAIGPDTIRIYSVSEATDISIRATGGKLKRRAEKLQEDVHTPTLPTRLGLDFVAPVKRAGIELEIRPAKLTAAGLLRNGGFEMQTFGWLLRRNGMGRLSNARAAAGKTSLHIKDASRRGGSDISSAPMAIATAGAFEIRGKVFAVAGDKSGLGVYVKYLDAEGELLNQQSKPGWLKPLGSLGGADRRWRNFAFRFTPPPGTVKLQVWLHTYNAARVELHLDDLTVAPVD